MQHRRRGQWSGHRAAYLDSGCGDGDGGGGVVSGAAALARRRRRPRSTASCAAAPVAYSRRASPGSGRSVSGACGERRKHARISTYANTHIAIDCDFPGLRELVPSYAAREMSTF